MKRYTVLSVPYRSAKVPPGGEDDSAWWFVHDALQNLTIGRGHKTADAAFRKAKKLNREVALVRKKH